MSNFEVKKYLTIRAHPLEPNLLLYELRLFSPCKKLFKPPLFVPSGWVINSHENFQKVFL